MDNLFMNAPEMEQKETLMEIAVDEALISENPTLENPMLENQTLDNPIPEYPLTENPTAENEVFVEPQDILAKAIAKLDESEKQKGVDAAQKKVIEHLRARMQEDTGLSEDWIQEHKTFEKCWTYILDEARKQAVKGCAVLSDDAVFELSEDYIRKDDKAQEEAKAKAEAERKAKLEKAKAEREAKMAKTHIPKKGEANGQTDLMSMLTSPAEPKKEEPKKPSGSCDGQTSLFDLMGGGENAQ